MSMKIENGRVIIDGEEHLLFSGEVHYWRLEPKYWRKILQALKDTGMDWLGTYVPWRKHDLGIHDYDFTGKTNERLALNKFLDLCQEMELNVYFRPGPLIVSEMACGGYPDWLGHSGAEYMVWTSTGEIPMGFPGEGNSGRSPSYLHPTYLDHCKRYLTEVNNVIAPYLHQNGGPIKLYQLDNEISFICRDAMFQSDYNPHIVGAGGEYHQWLMAKYQGVGDIPYANGASAIEEIQAPRNLDTWGKVDNMWYFDWAEFKEFIFSEYIRRLKKIHTDCGVDDVIFCTNFNPHRPNSMPNNWDEERKACDATNPGLIGYDFYRGPFLSRTGYGSLDRISRMHSSYFPLSWSAEFMCGFWNEDFNAKSYPYAEHHEFMADAVLAAGLKGISWYMFHDRIHWGGAPVSEQGHRRYAHKALTDIMDFVNGAKDFGSLQEDREIAVLGYRPYLRHAFMGDDMPADDSSVNLGPPNIDNIPSGRSCREFEGSFSILADAGYHPGVVDPDINLDDLKHYRAVFAATQTFMDAKTQQALLDYAKAGGVLIMGPAVPDKDETFKPCRILGEFIAAKQSGIFGKGTEVMVDGMPLQIEGEYYEIEGDPLFSAESGMPLVSGVEVGEGKILHLATYFTQSDDPSELGGNALFYKRLLESEEIYPRVVTSNPVNVKAVLMENEHEAFLYLLNHHYRVENVTVTLKDVAVKAIKDYRTGETFTVENGEFSIDVDTKRARLLTW